jgi:hypothetical protein
MIPNQLKQLTTHVYWLPPFQENYRPTLGAVAGEHSLLIVDAGNSPAHAGTFLEARRNMALPAPAYLALTHWRWEHVLGSVVIDTLMIASNAVTDRLRDTLRLDWRDKALDQRVEDGNENDFFRTCIKSEMSNVERGRIKLRLPDISFSQTMDVTLDPITCRLLSYDIEEAGLNTSLVYIPEDEVLFVGESFAAPQAGKNEACDPLRYSAFLDRMMALPAVYYIDSHSPSPLTRSEMEVEVKLIKKVGLIAQQNNQRTAALNQLKQEFGKTLPPGIEARLDAFLAGIKHP